MKAQKAKMKGITPSKPTIQDTSLANLCSTSRISFAASKESAEAPAPGGLQQATGFLSKATSKCW